MEETWALARATVLLAIVLIAFGLRLAHWGQDRFLEDEALYSYWGLQIATGADPMLNQEPVDKPPLHPYILALSFRIFEKNETAARLPSLFASVVSIALVFALARELYGESNVGLLSALLLALSPFDILFASTAFIDPLMTALILGALLTAAKGRLGLAGLLIALAAAAKQQGLFFLPLVIFVGWLSPHSRSPQGQSIMPGGTSSAADRIRSLWQVQWVRFALGFAVVGAGVFWWDLAREQRPGFLEQSFISYGGLMLAAQASLGERASRWLRLVGTFWVSPWLNGLLLFGFALWPLGSLFGWWERPSKLDLGLGAFVVGFLGLHWLVGFQVWDRYLLGLVPLLAILAARLIVAFGRTVRPRRWRRVYAIAVGLALVLLLTGPVQRATRSALAAGGDHGAYDGIDEIAAFVEREVPQASVLYHHWLGYHFRYYLYGSPLRLHWYPDLEDLQQDATVYRREPRYIAFPSWRDSLPAKKALADSGILLKPVLETTRRDGSVSFRLYRMEGP